MGEFDRLFEKVWWGWRMRGYTDQSSPVTLWPCAGGLIQVNVTDGWAHSSHRAVTAAQGVAVTLASRYGTASRANG